jgi:hypothetical protein
VSHTKVTQLLREGGYSLQGNRKTEEGDDHPDRDAPFRQINRAVQLAWRAGEPVISVDTKKKEEEGIDRQLPEPGPPMAQDGDGGQGQGT